MNKARTISHAAALMAWMLLAGAPAASGQVGVVAPQTFTFGAPPNEMVLENGQKLGPVTVVYETYGKLAI